jgi:membrane protein DedA with SNARE-associated domain
LGHVQRVGCSTNDQIPGTGSHNAESSIQSFSMPDFGELIHHWGYVAIVLFVVLGNMGLPVPEESILILSGYLAWRGDLKLPLVLAVGVMAAAAGDLIGFWIGRKYGHAALDRYRRSVLVKPERLEAVTRFLNRYGAFAVFAARFIPGLRFMAGPLAGAAGVRPSVFVAANLLGALVYVPYAVGLGFGLGYGAGEYAEKLRHLFGGVEGVVLFGTTIGVLLVLGWRVRRAMRMTRL